MNIYTLFPRSFGSNCYVVTSFDQDGRLHAAVIDPSVDADEILQLIADKGALLESIILTHGHFDHIMSLDNLRDMTGAPAYIHKDDAEMLSDGEKNAHSFFFGNDKKWRPAENLLADGDVLTLGSETMKVISTPGHSKGSICLLCGDFLITGDTLFANGYGRFDLHGGNPTQLAASLSGLRELDGSLTFYPGHGDPARLGSALDNLIYF